MADKHGKIQQQHLSLQQRMMRIWYGAGRGVCCRVDLRVGVTKKARRHPEADSLYVEEVEAGEEAPRQVVSGLVKYTPEAEMQMWRCVLVCNLKPANMRGVKSHAMVLAATSLDGLQVHALQH